MSSPQGGQQLPRIVVVIRKQHAPPGGIAENHLGSPSCGTEGHRLPNRGRSGLPPGVIRAAAHWGADQQGLVSLGMPWQGTFALGQGSHPNWGQAVGVQHVELVLTRNIACGMPLPEDMYAQSAVGE